MVSQKLTAVAASTNGFRTGSLWKSPESRATGSTRKGGCKTSADNIDLGGVGDVGGPEGFHGDFPSTSQKKIMFVPSWTDSHGKEAALNKLMTTKFLASAVPMALSTETKQMGLRTVVEWTPSATQKLMHSQVATPRRSTQHFANVWQALFVWNILPSAVNAENKDVKWSTSHLETRACFQKGPGRQREQRQRKSCAGAGPLYVDRGETAPRSLVSVFIFIAASTVSLHHITLGFYFQDPYCGDAGNLVFLIEGVQVTVSHSFARLVLCGCCPVQAAFCFSAVRFDWQNTHTVGRPHAWHSSTSLGLLRRKM